MEFREQNLTLNEIRELDIVDYLSSLGHQPEYIKNGAAYWYLSPLRSENTASFVVDRRKNRWFDFGDQTGGNLIDLGIRYHQCSVGKLIKDINQQRSFGSADTLPVVPPPMPEEKKSKLLILEEKPTITTYSLIKYLHDRRIATSVADKFCHEVAYEIDGRSFYGIGFKNDHGGFEIRNRYFKGSSSPKHITTIQNGAPEAHVFEGFMDFLSFMTELDFRMEKTGDFVILNSAAFFDQARPFMEQHETIRLWLDRDTTGQKYTQHALSLDQRYQDESKLYQGHKDLNEWLQYDGRLPARQVKQRLPKI